MALARDSLTDCLNEEDAMSQELSLVEEGWTRKLIERPLVTAGFLATTLALTGVCLAAQLWNLPADPLLWLLVVVSILPVYSTIYHAVLFAKAAISPAQVDAPSVPLIKGNHPAIAFIIASYEEPFEVAKMTFDCARDIAYPGPREIIVADNSQATDSEDYRRWQSYVESHRSDRNRRVTFVHNENKSGLKPGNLDLAITLVKDASYVMFLDIDSTLPRRTNMLAQRLPSSKPIPSSVLSSSTRRRQTITSTA
jgi:hypothetical protein